MTKTQKLTKGLSMMMATLSLTGMLLGGISTHAAQITNTANVSANTADPNTANNTATVTDELCYKSDLAVVVTSPATDIAGTTLTFTAVVTNNGPSMVTTADVIFKYNANEISNITPVTTTAGTLGTASTTGSGATSAYNNTLTGLTLASTQTVTLTFTGTINPTYSGTLNTLTTVSPTGPVNTATPTCSMSDTDTTNNVDKQGLGTVVSTSADMSIVKTSSGGGNSVGNVIGTVNENTDVTYTLTATNNGPSTAGTPIVIVDTYDSTKLQFVSISGAGFTCGAPDLTTPAASTITCTSSTALANASTAQLTAVFKALSQ
jgi:Domain of unknown function DUF11